MMTREERSRREATFPRCRCGNVAGVGQTTCSRCRESDALEARRSRRKDAVLSRIANAESVDDLRRALFDLAEHVYEQTQ